MDEVQDSIQHTRCGDQLENCLWAKSVADGAGPANKVIHAGLPFVFGGKTVYTVSAGVGLPAVAAVYCTTKSTHNGANSQDFGP